MARSHVVPIEQDAWPPPPTRWWQRRRKRQDRLSARPHPLEQADAATKAKWLVGAPHPLVAGAAEKRSTQATECIPEKRRRRRRCCCSRRSRKVLLGAAGSRRQLLVVVEEALRLLVEAVVRQLLVQRQLPLLEGVLVLVKHLHLLQALRLRLLHLVQQLRGGPAAAVVLELLLELELLDRLLLLELLLEALLLLLLVEREQGRGRLEGGLLLRRQHGRENRRELAALLAESLEGRRLLLLLLILLLQLLNLRLPGRLRQLRRLRAGRLGRRRRRRDVLRLESAQNARVESEGGEGQRGARGG